MALYIGDSEIFGTSWGSPDIVSIYSDKAVIQRWCQVLSALAQAQGEQGLIPANAAAEIVKHCRPENFPPLKLAELYQSTGHSTAGLIELFNQTAPTAAAEYFYFGATVQDITDTANALAFREAGRLVATALGNAESALTRLTEAHRATPMLGRTHGQFGSPVTFGFKCAGFLEELRKHKVKLESSLKEMETAQLAGAVGGMSAFGGQALKIRSRFCELLGLSEPVISWTSSRERLHSLASAIGLVSGTAARFANEIYNLQRSGLNEVQEGQPDKSVNSISMPHKMNPEVSEQIGSLHLMIGGFSQSLREGVTHEHERDGRAWKIEWACVPALLAASLKQVHLLADVAGNLQVNKERMLANITATRGHCFSENLQFTLARKHGLIKARRWLTELYAQPEATAQDLSLSAGKKFAGQLSAGELDEAFNLEASIKHCSHMCDLILRQRT